MKVLLSIMGMEKLSLEDPELCCRAGLSQRETLSVKDIGTGGLYLRFRGPQLPTVIPVPSNPIAWRHRAASCPVVRLDKGAIAHTLSSKQITQGTIDTGSAPLRPKFKNPAEGTVTCEDSDPSLASAPLRPVPEITGDSTDKMNGGSAATRTQVSVGAIGTG